MTRLARTILRADAIALGLAALGAFAADIVGVVHGVGPQGELLGRVPQAAVGFIEAHGLAFILALWFWCATPSRAWALTAGAVHALLGVCNLAFWDFFGASGLAAVGYVTTLMHALFVVLQACAWVAIAPSPRLQTA